MTIPVAVHPGGSADAGPRTFACTMCGDCCRNLLERKGAPDWPASFSRMAAAGFYGLPTEGGLQLWSWEKRRFEREAAARGLAVRFVPSVVVADDLGGRLVTLVYEMAEDTCPFLGPGITEGTLVCGAYEARPLVCRAFPVVMTGGAASPSSKCPEILDPAEATREHFLAAFGDAFLAAEGSTRVTREAGRLLLFLEQAGVVKLARALTREQVLHRLQRGPPADLWDLLAASGAVDRVEWWGRLNPEPDRMVTPHPG